MHSFQTFAPAVLAEMLRRQAPSRERTAFAWSLAVGPALARATAIEARDGILYVTPKDARWVREIERAGGTILTRLQALLGDEISAVRCLPAPAPPSFQR